MRVRISISSRTLAAIVELSSKTQSKKNQIFINFNTQFRKDIISLEMFDHQDLNFGKRIEHLSDQDMLNITSNHISEAILRSSLSNNKKFDDQILTYEAKIVNNEFVLSLMPKKENNFKRIMKESKGSQTGNDVKINTQEYNK